MSWHEALRTFEQHLPEATPRFVFSRPPIDSAFQDPRIDILYTYPPIMHTGLLHWVDEKSWYVGDQFIVAMELSKFLRLAMKGHAYASQLIDNKEQLGLYEWPAPVGPASQVHTWLSVCNAWLHSLRGIDDRLGC